MCILLSANVPIFIMDENFNRIAHYVVEKFIFLVKEAFAGKLLLYADLEMVYWQIIKLGEIVVHELREISLSENVNISLKSEVLCFHGWRDLLKSSTSCDKRVANLVKKLFSPGYMEVTSDEYSNYRITDVDLHKYLFIGVFKDVTDFAEAPVQMRLPCYFGTPSLKAFNNDSTQMSTSNGIFSSQFEKSRKQYLDGLCRMQKVTKAGFSILEPEKCDASTSRDEDIGNEKSSDQLWNSKHLLLPLQTKKIPSTRIQSFPRESIWTGDSEHVSQVFSSKSDCNETSAKVYVKPRVKDLILRDNDVDDQLTFDSGFSPISTYSTLSDSEAEKFTDDSKGPKKDFRSWENSLGRNFLSDFRYISELSGEEAFQSISGKEYSLYSSLLNPVDAILEDDMVHDILDALVGTPSNTFFYDIHAQRFRMKFGLHVQNLSAECCSWFAPYFLDCGSMYYALQKFCRCFPFADEGTVIKGMKRGIQKVLILYKEYIEAVKVNRPTMIFLKSDVLKNAQLLHEFGIICGIDPDTMLSKGLPKGLGLLGYLHNLARSHSEKGKRIMIDVLLKYSYEPYISFLNEWLNDGVCNDPYWEFQIVEDPNYLQRRDSLYWHYAYTKSKDDPTRDLPSELEAFSERIFECGKSIKLLKDISPELSTLKFFCPNPPPSLSMVFSFPAVLSKIFSCLSYMVFKKDPDSEFKTGILDTSGDGFYIDCQKLVNEEQMLKLVKSRSDILAGKCEKSNTLDFKAISPHIKEYPDENIHFKIKDDNFSGKLYNNVGLLFSSCGFEEKDMLSEYSFQNSDYGNFPSCDSSLQLCLSSYSQKLPVSPVVKSEKSFVSEILHTLLPTNPFVMCLWQNRRNEAWLLDNVSESDRKLLQNMYFETFVDSVRDFSTLERTEKHHESNNIRNDFVDKLASLLISESEESIDDIYSCVQFTSLQRLMILNFQYTLNIRAHVIERAIMKSIMKQYKLNFLLLNLRKFYFLQDEIFREKLCEPLFCRVIKCKTSKEFADFGKFKAILYGAVPDFDAVCNSNIFSLNAAVNFMLLDMPLERPDFLDLFLIECEVSWPLNLIVHDKCLQDYSKILSMLLKVEFSYWLLIKTFGHLHIVAKGKKMNESPQFHMIMVNRFKMEHFIRVIRDCIYVQLQGPVWKNLKDKLCNEESTIYLLIDFHEEYLSKVLARCFMTNHTEEYYALLSSIFHQVFKFCNAILNCDWKKNEGSEHFETCIFRWMIQVFGIFEESQKKFKKYLGKRLSQEEKEHFQNEGYQEFRDIILTSLTTYD